MASIEERHFHALFCRSVLGWNALKPSRLNDHPSF